MEQADLPRCGEPATALDAAPGPLVVTASFPPVVVRRGDGTFTGTVTITAATGPVTGVMSPYADVYVAHSGTVVATPLVKDLLGVPVRLSPGAGHDLAARGSIRACADPGAGPAARPMLPPGRYDVFTVVAVTDEAGHTIVASGGPWPIVVA